MRQSEKIQALIKQTQTAIAQCEKELGELPPEKERILAGEELDTKALRKLEEREASLRRDLENYQQRVVLLRKQQEGAEREEASDRLGAIVAEAGRLVQGEAQARAAFEQAGRALTERARELASFHEEHGELMQETAYWLDRFNLARPSTPRLGELPNPGTLNDDVAAVFERVRNAGLSSPWARRRGQLQQERQREPRPAAATPAAPRRP